jgi:hypothetical protein
MRKNFIVEEKEFRKNFLKELRERDLKESEKNEI